MKMKLKSSWEFQNSNDKKKNALIVTQVLLTPNLIYKCKHI